MASISLYGVNAQVDLNKGLMLYLPFNGNTLDASPNANHATNMGATLAADQWGNPNSAYLFDGKTNYMQIPNSTSLQCDSQITICAKVNVKGFYNGTCFGNVIINKGNADYFNGNYGLRFNSFKYGCAAKDTTTQNYFGFVSNKYSSSLVTANSPYISINEWDCLIMTFDKDTSKMYVNGVLRYKFAPGSLIGKNNHDVFLGHMNNAAYPYWFNGVMDEVRIYNRALNTLEIDSVCSSSNPNQTAIRKVQTPESLQLLTNPVRNELTLSLSANKLGGELNIIDMTGRRVVHIQNLQQNIIAVDAIIPGVYIVSYTIDNTLFRAKMIKQ